MLIALLVSPHFEVVEQAIWCLGNMTGAEDGGAEAQVSSGDTLCREVNLIVTGGSFFSLGLTGTDCNFDKFETGGGNVNRAAVIYFNLLIIINANSNTYSRMYCNTFEITQLGNLAYDP